MVGKVSAGRAARSRLRSPPFGRTDRRLVLGLQPVREAIAAHGAAVDLLVETRAREPERLEALVRYARDRGVTRIDSVERRELDRLSAGVLHQGVAAWAPPLELKAPEVLLADEELLAVALDGIEDPQNFGAAVRSAVGIANAWIVWPEHGAAPLSAATFRASAGAIEVARLCRVPSLVGFLTEARDRGVLVIGLDPQASTRLRDLDLRAPAVLVVGGEHRGLQRAVRRVCNAFASVVTPRAVASLNASVAAAVALYEASIQRDKSGA